jgi:hypothetical protein
MKRISSSSVYYNPTLNESVACLLMGKATPPALKNSGSCPCRAGSAYISQRFVPTRFTDALEKGVRLINPAGSEYWSVTDFRRTNDPSTTLAVE